MNNGANVAVSPEERMADNLNVAATLCQWGYRSAALLAVVSLGVLKMLCTQETGLTTSACDSDKRQMIGFSGIVAVQAFGIVSIGCRLGATYYEMAARDNHNRLH